MTTQLESIPLLLYKSSIKMWIVLFFGHNIDIVTWYHYRNRDRYFFNHKSLKQLIRLTKDETIKRIIKIFKLAVSVE